jgi:hypothetical protein
LTSPDYRPKALDILGEVIANRDLGAEVPLLLGVGFTTLPRSRRKFAGYGVGLGRSKVSPRYVLHLLSEEKRQTVLLIRNGYEFAALPPGQIEEVIEDLGLCISSERS